MSDIEEETMQLSTAPPQKKEETNPLSSGLTLDDASLTETKQFKFNPLEKGKLTPQFIEVFTGYLAKGVPMSACSLYLGVSQGTAYNWFKEGKKELESLTPEQIASVDDPNELLSLKAKFYIECCKAKATPITELQDMLYDRAFEAGKEWIATYILERLCPETYNLKYKIQQDVSANVSANVVQFQFIGGRDTRSEEDLQFIDDQMNALADKYAERDLINVDENGELIDVTPDTEVSHESNDS